MESRYLRNANDNKNIYNINGNSYDAIDNEKATMITIYLHVNSFQQQINNWGVMLWLCFKFDWQFNVTLII